MKKRSLNNRNLFLGSVLIPLLGINALAAPKVHAAPKINEAFPQILQLLAEKSDPELGSTFTSFADFEPTQNKLNHAMEAYRAVLEQKISNEKLNRELARAEKELERFKEKKDALNTCLGDCWKAPEKYQRYEGGFLKGLWNRVNPVEYWKGRMNLLKPQRWFYGAVTDDYLSIKKDVKDAELKVQRIKDRQKKLEKRSSPGSLLDDLNRAFNRCEDTDKAKIELQICKTQGDLDVQQKCDGILKRAGVESELEPRPRERAGSRRGSAAATAAEAEDGDPGDLHSGGTTDSGPCLTLPSSPLSPAAARPLEDALRALEAADGTNPEITAAKKALEKLLRPDGRAHSPPPPPPPFAPARDPLPSAPLPDSPVVKKIDGIKIKFQDECKNTNCKGTIWVDGLPFEFHNLKDLNRILSLDTISRSWEGAHLGQSWSHNAGDFPGVFSLGAAPDSKNLEKIRTALGRKYDVEYESLAMEAHYLDQIYGRTSKAEHDALVNHVNDKSKRSPEKIRILENGDGYIFTTDEETPVFARSSLEGITSVAKLQELQEGNWKYPFKLVSLGGDRFHVIVPPKNEVAMELNEDRDRKKFLQYFMKSQNAWFKSGAPIVSSGSPDELKSMYRRLPNKSPWTIMDLMSYGQAYNSFSDLVHSAKTQCEAAQTLDEFKTCREALAPLKAAKDSLSLHDESKIIAASYGFGDLGSKLVEARREIIGKIQNQALITQKNIVSKLLNMDESGVDLSLFNGVEVSPVPRGQPARNLGAMLQDLKVKARRLKATNVPGEIQIIRAELALELNNNFLRFLETLPGYWARALPQGTSDERTTKALKIAEAHKLVTVVSVLLQEISQFSKL